MTVTFLVAINLDIIDPSTLLTTADDIHDDLVQMGHDVESVAPWARPNMPLAQPAGGFTSLTAPPTTL